MFWIILAVAAAGMCAVIERVDRQKRPVDAWRQLATRRGGVFIDEPGRPAVDVAVGQACVRLELNPDSSDGPFLDITCRACYLVPLGPVFHIEAGSIGPIGKLLGAQDVEFGVDREFDECFVVKTDQRDAVRRMWSPQAMRLMFQALRDADVSSDGREIKLVRFGINASDKMEEMIDLMSELANADLFGINALRTLPGARYHPPTGPWNERSTPYAIIEQPVPVTLMPVDVRGRAVTRATVGDGPRAQRLEITMREDGTVEPADAAAQMRPEAAALLGRLGNGTLVIDGADTSFTWSTVETDAERLLAGARLLAMLAGGPTLGAYR